MKCIIVVFALTFLLSTATNVEGQICPVMPGAELITNGDFESGVTSFVSDYPIYTGAPPTFSGNGSGVWTNPNNVNPGYFANMGDHTTGSGNMFILDVDGNLGKDVYRTDVIVLANTTYFFSAWFANINLSTNCGDCNNPGYTPPVGCAVPADCSPANTKYEKAPKLKFSINGTQVGGLIKSDSTNHLWNQFYYMWNSGATNGTISLRIENMETSPFGNDLAIDDISFRTSCENIRDLNTLGQSSTLMDTVKTCNVDFPLVLDPGLPVTYNYSWRNSSGSLLTAPATNPTYSVNSIPADETKYYLCYEYISGCPRVDSVLFKVTPLTVELGANKTMCAPVNLTLSSGVSSPPVSVQWYKDGSPVATTPDYVVTDIGVYSVDLFRTGCGTAADNVSVVSPSSSISGSGLYCTSNNTAQFTATGSTQIKWYSVPSGGTALNPGDANPTISTSYTLTNTTVPGCASGLYAEDISSYPGTVMPSPPCGTNNSNGIVDLMIEVNQALVLSSFDFYHNAGWGSTGTFSFTILDNNPTGGPWCGGCSPPGNNDGAGTILYSETSPSFTVGGVNTIRTFNLTSPQTLTPGKYWLRLQAINTALGIFDGCSPAISSNGSWTTPYTDNTGNNVLLVEKAVYNGNVFSTGGLFNIKFQVGTFNACSRLFVCATVDCALPVQLIDFSGFGIQGLNSISWKTVNENNSAFFQLERSSDGISFESIAKINTHGNSTVIQDYSYNDNIFSEVLYYRLVQVDQDGSLQYTEIIKIEQGATNIPSLLIVPTPVVRGNMVSVSITGFKEDQGQLEIIDALGRLLISRPIQLNNKSAVELSTSTFVPGVYYIRIIGSIVWRGTCIIQ